MESPVLEVLDIEDDPDHRAVQPSSMSSAKESISSKRNRSSVAWTDELPSADSSNNPFQSSWNGSLLNIQGVDSERSSKQQSPTSARASSPSSFRRFQPHAARRSSGDSSSESVAYTKYGYRKISLDRIPLYIWMLLSLIVPLAFLIAYQSTLVHSKLTAVHELQDQRNGLHLIVQCGEQLMHESLAASAFLSEPVDSLLIPILTEKFNTSRDRVNGVCGPMMQTIQSRISAARLALLRASSAEYLALGERILNQAVDGFELRREYTRHMKVGAGLMEDVGTLVGGDTRHQLNMVMAISFGFIWLGHCRATGTVLLRQQQRVSLPTSNMSPVAVVELRHELTECWTACREHFELASNHAVSSGLISNPLELPVMQTLAVMVNTLRTNGDASAVPESGYKAAFTSAFDFILLLVSELVSEIAAARQLKEDALAEGMKLLGAFCGCVFATVTMVVFQRRAQQRQNAALGYSRMLNRAVRRFVPRNQLRLIGSNSITEVRPGDHTEVAQTMLFSDIRNFTSISEKMSNEELFVWLQGYYERMTAVTENNNGYVDKFIGDGIFCVFPQPSHAILCGLEMQTNTANLNASIAGQGWHLFEVGVGLHHGIVVAGVLGDEKRLTCTLIASEVNLASRLEGLTRVYGAKIIASKAVIERVDLEAVHHRYLGAVEVAGALQVLDIYEIFDHDPPTLRNFKMDTRRRFEALHELRVTDPEKYESGINGLAKAAASAGVVDQALRVKQQAASMSPLSPTDAFTKRGSIRPPQVSTA